MTGGRVEISHLKVDSPNRWGASAQGAGADRRGAGQRHGRRADQYAYTAASSALGIRFPSWALEGGQSKIAERLNDAATWEKIKRDGGAARRARPARSVVRRRRVVPAATRR